MIGRARRTARGVATFLLASAVFAALAAPARAQDTTTEPAPADRWTVTVAPYLWMISLDGDASIGRIDTDVDVPFRDALQDLSFGAMLLGTVRRGRLGLAVDAVFARVSSDETVGPFDLDLRSDLGQVAIAPFYRILEHRYGETATGRPLRFFVEPLAGARINWLRGEIQVRGGRQVDQTELWVDPIVGVRTGLDLSERFAVFAEGDIGGVVTGADLAWNLQAHLAYRTELFGREAILSAGYRAYAFDYESGRFEVDVIQHGPIIGTAIRF